MAKYKVGDIISDDTGEMIEVKSFSKNDYIVEYRDGYTQSLSIDYTDRVYNKLISSRGYTIPDKDFEVIEEKVSASETQVAGNHYSKLKIQPMEYCLQNNLNYSQSNAIKYITRYKDKNGIEDLKKAIHCIELLIEFEEKE